MFNNATTNPHDFGGGGTYYPYQAEVAKALSRVEKIAAGATENIGWWKVGTIPISKFSQTYENPSVIFLVNGIYASQGQNGAAESGVFELEARKNGATFQNCGINLLCGSINPDDVCATNDADTITLYYNLPSAYNSAKITVLSDESALDNDPIEIFEFSAEYYGAEAPEGSVYAVVRNNASFSTRLSNSIVLGRRADNFGWHKFAEIKAADIGNTVQAGYSSIILVNCVVPDTWQQATYGYGCGSSIVEIDGRANANGTYVNDYRLKINILCGFLPVNNICGVTSEDLTTISLYINTVIRYGQYSFSIFSENCENSTEVRALTFMDEFYGTEAPSNAVYGVVRNNASKAIETSNNLLLNGDFQLNTQGLSVYPSNSVSTDECLDGWVMVDSASQTGNVEVNDGGGITMNATATGFGIRQVVLPETTGAGRNYTLSINVSIVGGNSEALRIYLRNTTYTAVYKSIDISAAGIYSFTVNVPSNATGNLQVYIAVEGAGSLSGECNYTIDWIKLEEGSVSTAPNGLIQNATEALYARAIPVASETVFGGAKIYVDADGYLNIDTQ